MADGILTPHCPSYKVLVDCVRLPKPKTYPKAPPLSPEVKPFKVHAISCDSAADVEATGELDSASAPVKVNPPCSSSSSSSSEYAMRGA